ncbi:unnamed protein product [Rhizoctonia solani]|uniref:Uncharacterized protein n=1 Tax=Rhizoctonia solani TaxID=456999 RepID=A0A8H2Y3A5_9AGAM|nr:unnamed protein product [Rhizoctonia solani]
MPVPLAEMGASILSLSLQERMRHQQGGGEKEDNEPTALVKSPVVSMDIATTGTISTTTTKKTKIANSGDAPTTKKLRLTISAAPPAASLSTHSLQLLSPPDTSSNASKAPGDERCAIPISSSTPGAGQLSMPDFDLDLSNLASLSLSTLDSNSDSETSSESSSESSSDSPDLSSSTSTHSPPQNKAKGKGKATVSVSSKSRTSTPAAETYQSRGPSTPPRRKRQAHQPGWVGWVQTEESPDHSRLIRLDDVPVILGRRTRSGKEFAEPPLRRRSTAPNDPQRQAKPLANPRRTGQKSKHQSAWQEAQKRGVEDFAEGKADGEQALETVESGYHDNHPYSSKNRKSHVVSSMKLSGSAKAASSNSGDMRLTSKLEQASPSDLTKGSQPTRGVPSSATKSAKSSAVPQSNFASAPVVLKLTRSDTVITPTGARPNEPEHKDVSSARNSPNKGSEPEKVEALADLPMRTLPASASARKDAAQTNPDKTTRSGVKGTAQSHAKDTSSSVSRSALGTSNSSTLINGAKLSSTNSSPDSVFKKSPTLAIGSDSRNPSAPGLTEKPIVAPRNLTEKPKITKVGGVWINAAKPSPNSSRFNELVPHVGPNNTLKSTSTSKTTKPFPMPSRIERGELDSKQSHLTLLGKRKGSPSPLPSAQSSSSSQRRAKKRKLLLSSSDESEGPKFVVNPFDRRAKQMELTRKGVSGEAFQSEMKRWLHEKKAEWKDKERLKDKQKEKQGERTNDSELRNAIAEGKPVSEAVRHRLAGSSTSTRVGDAKLARKKAWSTEWGMDVAKVSVAGNGEKRTQPKAAAEMEKRDPSIKDARESNAGYVKREPDALKELAKLKRVVP